MTKLKLEMFGGIVPRTSGTMLKDNEAQEATNVRLYSGELRPWRKPLDAYTPATAAVRSIYLLRNPVVSDPIWLTWAAEDVDVVRSPQADVDDIRVYYTGDGVPKKTNWDMATSGSGDYPQAFLKLGVPAPASAPTLAAVAGSSVAAETRYYVYTYVSTFGSITEESAPSAASAAITITAAQKVTVTVSATVPTTDLNITHKRIYRTLTGELGDGAYVFVAEITAATTSYSDDLLAEALGEALGTTGWVMPPDDLNGLTAMPNGMLAGFVNNQIYFCEPYAPHAWPVAYIQSIPERIVGLGSYGNTLVVMTDSFPHAITGNDPAQMTADRIPIPEACVSSKSIATDAQGVLYVSPNGVVGIGPGQRGVLTNALFRRVDWQKYTPTSMVGDIYDGKYILAYRSTLLGDQMLVLSRDDYPALSELDERAVAMFVDDAESKLYYLEPTSNLIYRLDADDVNLYNYEWRSKRFVLPFGTIFSAIKVDVDYVQQADNTTFNLAVAAANAANAVIWATLLVGTGGFTTDPLEAAVDQVAFDYHAFNGSTLQEPPNEAAQLGAVITLYGDLGEPVSTHSIDSWDVQRLEEFRSRELTIKAAGNLNIRSITVASSLAELRE